MFSPFSVTNDLRAGQLPCLHYIVVREAENRQQGELLLKKLGQIGRSPVSSRSKNRERFRLLPGFGVLTKHYD